MMPELEPLAADVLFLLEAEKPIADLDATAKAAIRASVEARVGLGPGGGGDGGGAGGGRGEGGGGAGTAGSSVATGGLAGARAIAAIAATFAIGVATGLVVAPSTTAPLSSVQTAPVIHRPDAPSASTPASAPEVLDVPAIPVGSLPQAAASSPKPSMPEPSEPPATSARGLAAERSLLDVARAALARGEAADALAAADRHSRDYPDGVLVEEREALAIKALAALGRRDIARARAHSFEQRFPNGLMLRSVKGAVGEP